MSTIKSMSQEAVKDENTEFISCDDSLQSNSDHHLTDVKQEEVVSGFDVCSELAENHPKVGCLGNNSHDSDRKDIVIKSEPIEFSQTLTDCTNHDDNVVGESMTDALSIENKDYLKCKLVEMTDVQNISDLLVMRSNEAYSIGESKISTPHSKVSPDKKTKRLMSFQLKLGPLKRFANKKDIDGNEVINFNCSKCAFDTQVLTHFKNHYKSEHMSDLHPCDNCSILMLSQRSLKCHQRKFHTTSKIFRCSKCDFSVDSSRSMERHRLMKHSQKKHKCTECDRRCYTQTFLQSHITSAHRALLPNSEVHSCHICHKVFPALSLLSRHLRTHTGIRPYACDKCDYKAPLKSGLRRHTIRKHSHSKEFLCTRCTMNFTDQQSLIEHKQTRHANINCPLCSFKSNTWKTLVDHHKIVHNSAVALRKPFQCSKCLTFFVRQDSLNRHIENETCSVLYPSKIRAESSRSKSRSSSIIDSQYSDEQKVNINGHVKLIAQKSMKHSVQGKDEKHHVCQACYEQFPSLKVLTRHLKYCVFK